MKRTCAVLLAALCLAALTVSSMPTRASATSMVRMPFRVSVPSQLPSSTTLWVAYGPVAGKFGLIRLRPGLRGEFVASGRFPAGTSATFYYIEGHGTIRTRAGVGPGNPVQTIGHVGPVVIGKQPVPLFRVPAPAG